MKWWAEKIEWLQGVLEELFFLIDRLIRRASANTALSPPASPTQGTNRNQTPVEYQTNRTCNQTTHETRIFPCSLRGDLCVLVVATTTGLATNLAIFVEGQETTREDSRGHSVEVRGGACLGERRLGLLGECLVEALNELSAQLLGSLVGEQHEEDEAEQRASDK